jgi:hypothetical protein
LAGLPCRAGIRASLGVSKPYAINGHVLEGFYEYGILLQRFVLIVNLDFPVDVSVGARRILLMGFCIKNISLQYFYFALLACKAD